MTEQELVALLQQKEEAAFKELVTLFQHKVYNTAMGLLQNARDAEDIAQEVFIQVYKSISKFKGDSSLTTWIYRITVTKCLDFLRRKKRIRRFGFMHTLFGEDNKPFYEPEDTTHPGVQLDQKENAAILFKMINKLPESQKTAFILNKIEELSYREIAAILKTTEAAVDSLLQRARINIKKNIQQYINNSL